MKDGRKKVQKYFRVARLPCCWMITAAAPPFALKQPTRSDAFLYISESLQKPSTTLDLYIGTLCK